MVGLRPSKLLTLRLLSITLISLVLASTPFHGIIYGTASALNFRFFKVISPLDWLILNLGAGTILADLLAPGLIGIIVIIILGRFICGWVCPVGIMLEYIHGPLNGHRGTSRASSCWDRYAILTSILLSGLIFNFTAPYLFSPPGILHRILSQYLTHGIVGVDLSALSLIIILDSLATRYGYTWCSSICPLGTVLSSLGVVNLFRLRIERDRCIECWECERVCPMRIPILEADRFRMMSCSKCLKCLESCPVKAVRLVLY
ncbi:MAG: 4Fe-4S binding protein [Candidatus Bathyarchaeia archaeon]